MAQSNPATVDELFSEVKIWQTQTGAAIPQAANPEFDEAAEQAAILKLNSKSKRPKRAGKK